jgi:hypothetical protein
MHSKSRTSALVGKTWCSFVSENSIRNLSHAGRTRKPTAIKARRTAPPWSGMTVKVPLIVPGHFWNEAVFPQPVVRQHLRNLKWSNPGWTSRKCKSNDWGSPGETNGALC